MRGNERGMKGRSHQNIRTSSCIWNVPSRMRLVSTDLVPAAVEEDAAIDKDDGVAPFLV